MMEDLTKHIDIGVTTMRRALRNQYDSISVLVAPHGEFEDDIQNVLITIPEDQFRLFCPNRGQNYKRPLRREFLIGY